MYGTAYLARHHARDSLRAASVAKVADMEKGDRAAWWRSHNIVAGWG